MSESRKVVSLHLITDINGTVVGQYDDPSCTPRFVSVGKEGYQSYSSGFRSTYVLRKTISASDVTRVASLSGDTQRIELRELLAGSFEEDFAEFLDCIFYYEARLRPALRSLAEDPTVTELVRELLSMIAVREDLRLMTKLPSPASSDSPERWRYAGATALVNPETEQEWDFLRRCSFDEFDDHWVDAGTIQSLKLTASSRSREILEEARQKNQFQARGLVNALEYIGSNPSPLLSTDLPVLAERVAQVLKIGNWKENSEPRFNETGDKALVDFAFESGRDRLIYTATFHRVEDKWTLRSARETYQALMPAISAAAPKQ